ncbi:MAG: F0F1 ATP synthase subunit delta [Rhodobacteraceae bacterium]|nr:F0F1 ATP synthase subunit delta [Paracoccaceae bacterium]
MSATASITAGASGRYAIALFQIAKAAKSLAAIEADLDSLQGALDESADLRDVITSPLLSREEQGKALRALTDKMGLGADVSNTVALMAENRRLDVLPAMISQVKALAADDRGEVSADVIAAKALTEKQSTALAAALKKSVGKDVKVNVTVDKDLIGGLIVKVGSLMIDSSLRSKLNNLQNAMKEVG